MQQIADWLEKLGLGQYGQRFTENGISVAALRHLTDQDLKDIGVLLGHRRTMLAAIAEFAGAPPEAPKTDRAKDAPDTAERRQVSILFSDLVGSTVLSARGAYSAGTASGIASCGAVRSSKLAGARLSPKRNIATIK